MSQVGKMDACASERCGTITPNMKAVRSAQSHAGEMSGSVESLLAAKVRGEHRRREEDQEHRRKLAAAWNSFDERHGCFADEWNQDFMPEDAQGR